MPAVGDSKRAIDEYVSEILMGGRSTISYAISTMSLIFLLLILQIAHVVIFNVCEDSLLATPLIVDLAILAELFTRISYAENGAEHKHLYSVLSLLSYMLSTSIKLISSLRFLCPSSEATFWLRAEAPLVKPGTDVVNGLSRQRAALDHTFRALLGLQPVNEMEVRPFIAHYHPLRQPPHPDFDFLYTAPEIDVVNVK